MESGGPPAQAVTIHQRRFGELSLLELHSILELRSRVFVLEQACVYNDIDGRDVDGATTHLWIDIDGDIAAYLRMLEHTADVRHAVIGRVVTHPLHRGRGLAADLVRHAIGAHAGPIVLEAQAHLEEWYGRFGFIRTGDDYLEDGIPHVPMRRSHPVE